MRYEILGNCLPVVVCHLNPGEAVITESGSMSWMSPNMQMETNSGGGMKKAFGRLLSGDSIFQNRYTPQGGEGLIACASSFPGAINALEYLRTAFRSDTDCFAGVVAMQERDEYSYEGAGGDN